MYLLFTDKGRSAQPKGITLWKILQIYIEALTDQNVPKNANNNMSPDFVPENRTELGKN